MAVMDDGTLRSNYGSTNTAMADTMLEPVESDSHTASPPPENNASCRWKQLGQRIRGLRKRPSSPTVAYKACETCRGSGYLTEGQGDRSELVALIPHGDSRLGPNHSRKYAILVAIAICLGGALLAFFLFPRTPQVDVTADLVLFNQTSPSTMLFSLELNFTVINKNYFNLQVQSADVFVVLAGVVVGTFGFNDTYSVTRRDTNVDVNYLTVTITSRQLVASCTVAKAVIFLNIKAEMLTSFLSSTSRVNGHSYQYLSCPPYYDEEFHYDGGGDGGSERMPPQGSAT